MTEIIKLENELLSRLKLKKKNSNVYYAQEYPFFLETDDLDNLITLSGMKNIDKFRICMHKNDKAHIQEMLLILLKPQFIKPHKQEKSTISYHVIEGLAELRLYDDNGNVEFVRNLSSTESGIQHIRLEANKFRSIRSISNSFVYLEIANGPFRDSNTIWL